MVQFGMHALDWNACPAASQHYTWESARLPAQRFMCTDAAARCHRFFPMSVCTEAAITSVASSVVSIIRRLAVDNARLQQLLRPLLQHRLRCTPQSQLSAIGTQKKQYRHRRMKQISRVLSCFACRRIVYIPRVVRQIKGVAALQQHLLAAPRAAGFSAAHSNQGSQSTRQDAVCTAVVCNSLGHEYRRRLRQDTA